MGNSCVNHLRNLQYLIKLLKANEKQIKLGCCQSVSNSDCRRGTPGSISPNLHASLFHSFTTSTIAKRRENQLDLRSGKREAVHRLGQQ